MNKQTRHIAGSRALVLAAACGIVLWGASSEAGTTTTFYGTNSAETVVVAQHVNGSCASGYEYVACIGSSWTYGNCYTGATDTVQAYTYGGADSVYVFRYNHQDLYCGGWLHVYPMDRSACPYMLVVDAGSGDDYVEGCECAEALYGGYNNDTIYGYGGGDVIYGGLGDDAMHGGDGTDTLDGGSGTADEMYGDSDNDCLIDDAYAVCDCGAGTDYHECYDDENDPVSCYWEGCLSEECVDDR